MKKFAFLAILLVASLIAQAQSQDAIKYAGTISKDDLAKHLKILASDAYEGRETGEKGQKMAAEYIVNHFKGLGLSAPVKANANPYLQEVKLAKKSWGEVYVQAKKNKLVHFQDYFTRGDFSTNGKEESVEIVFVGYGIDSETYSDYKDIDVKGKFVVVFGGEPKGADGKYLISKAEKPSKAAETGSKLRAARQKGAKGIFIAYDTDAAFKQTLSVYKSYLSAPSLTLASEKNNDDMAFFSTSPSQIPVLLGLKPKKFNKAIAKMQKEGKSIAGAFSSTILIKSERKIEPASSENVLGYMEGTDKKDELLVVTAHYDHIGITNGEVNNGADDDGSGTVTVLEIAEAFAKAKAEGKSPRRSILFMTVTGEEKGLLGSEYYSENPIFPLSSTVANLNIDMVGRVDEKHKDNPNYIYIIGSDMLSSDLHQLSEETAKKYAPDVALDYLYNSEDDPNRFYYRSDHYNFAKHNIPVVFYFNGTHEDYHKPTDDVEKINFDKMEKIARLIFSTAWEIANREQRLVVDKAKK